MSTYTTRVVGVRIVVDLGRTFVLMIFGCRLLILWVGFLESGGDGLLMR
jgi:hypothetical protein